MRYIRFLKTPRIVHDKKRPGVHVSCLITITSDLGDSFLPYDLTLSAELIEYEQLAGNPDTEAEASDLKLLHAFPNNVITWKTIHWKAGLRSLAVTIPLSRTYHQNGPLIVRIGTEPKSPCDELDKLLQHDSRGVVSVWSAPFTLETNSPGLKTAERRFKIGDSIHHILEETGESIARHLWDAGVTLSFQLPYLLTSSSVFDKAFTPLQNLDTNDLADSQNAIRPLHIIELGTGCGIVGISLSHLLPHSRISLTDLPEAHDIVALNTSLASKTRTNDATLSFVELDWDSPGPLPPPSNNVDLVIAADCTYNADSSPAFVHTIQAIAARSPDVTVAVAMKKRHESEDVFFELMRKAKFRSMNAVCFPLPGDERAGEEGVEVWVYEYHGVSERGR
ncbi:hypothetical protein BU23DRAFT_556027 [Bimuria novae-zelandiae CBS 107.79]|uniref:Uncharacterized protein n=1 Tax=Bimuria novae-zelandiae CBS 107.79 TaxID=1447943 RepID=A0A6A5V5J2_9PLEO|nr:hypothetical protein BU23DRAFT_556027 [Bimuria novae-zelandiae CBS 107.79]